MKTLCFTILMVLVVLCCMQMRSARSDAQVSNSEVRAAKQAAMDGDSKTLAAILKAGLDPNLRNKAGDPLIDFAHTPAILKILLDAGANPDVLDSLSVTPLMTFSAMHSVEGVQLLLSHGAHANMRGKRGGTPLWGACAASRVLDEYGKPQRTPQADDLLTENIAKQLIAAGADINARPKNDLSPLGYALMTEKDRVAYLLIRAGANVNARPEGGLSPLGFAAAGGREDLVHVLLLKGARPGDADKTETTPLILAAERGDANIVEQLIKAGADVNHKDSEGATALDHARLMGNSDSYTLLETAGSKGRPGCQSHENALSLEESLKTYFCSEPVQIVHRGDMARAGMEFAVAGVPESCPSVQRELSHEEITSGRLLGQVVILRKTPRGWSREFSADHHFVKNSRYLLRGPVWDTSPVGWLVQAEKTVGQKLSAPLLVSEVETCVVLAGGALRLSWELNGTRVRILGEDGSIEPELTQSH